MSNLAYVLEAPCRIQRRIEAISEIPPLPDMVHKLQLLRDDPNAGAEDLARVVELDPSLAMQVMSYAASPYFGFRGKLDSIQTAIARVLGFDLVMNMSLGLATGSSLHFEGEGALGLQGFWRHAVYNATLSQHIAKLIPRGSLIKPGTVYLAGLLHNFGLVLWGHLFPEEYARLNQLARENPVSGLQELEQRLSTELCIEETFDHCQSGAWLMQAWQMPAELLVAVREHHAADYRGPHWVYAGIVNLANHALSQHGIGDAPATEMPVSLLVDLGLQAGQIEAMLQQLMDSDSGLEAMASRLAAGT